VRSRRNFFFFKIGAFPTAFNKISILLGLSSVFLAGSSALDAAKIRMIIIFYLNYLINNFS